MDTVIMASRVALLVLVTVAFAMMWSGDDPDRIAAMDQSAKVLIGSANRRSRLATGGNSRINCDLRLAAISRETIERPTIPVPAGISPGTYLVTDQFGNTSTRVISPIEATNVRNDSGSLPNHYSVEVGSRRWHYILIETSPRISVSVSSAAK